MTWPLLAAAFATAITAWPLLARHDRRARKRRRAAREHQNHQ